MPDRVEAEREREERFVELRKRLDALGFRDAFGVESMDLVQALLGDLLDTADRLQELLSKRDVMSLEILSRQDQLTPLRKENARLLQENNALHAEIIKSAEAKSTLLKTLTTQNSDLSAKNNEIVFVTTQVHVRLRELEKQLEKYRKRVEQLTNNRVGVVIPGSDEPQPVLGRRAEIAMRNTLAPSNIVREPLMVPAPSPYLADIVRLAETQRSRVEADLEVVVSERAVLHDRVGTLEALVRAREEEIARLTGVVERQEHLSFNSTVPADHLQNQANERIIAQLTTQLTLLQERLHALEGSHVETAVNAAARKRRNQSKGSASPSTPVVATARVDTGRPPPRKPTRTEALLKENKRLTSCLEDVLLKNQMLSQDLTFRQQGEQNRLMTSRPLDPRDARAALDRMRARGIHPAETHHGVSDIF